MKSYIKIVKAMFSGNKKVLAEAFSVMVILLAFEMTIPVCVNKMINGLAVKNETTNVTKMQIINVIPTGTLYRNTITRKASILNKFVKPPME